MERPYTAEYRIFTNKKVSIKNITYIFEKINDFANESSKSDLVKKIRLTLSQHICRANQNSEGVICAFDMSDKTLDNFLPSFEEDDDAIIKIDADFAETLANKLSKKIKKYNIENPKLIVPLELRQIMFTLLSNYINNLTVLAREEIGCSTQLEIIAEV